MDISLFVRQDMHVSKEDRERDKQNPTLSSEVRIISDPGCFTSPEEILAASHQKYLDSLEPATTCYDKYHRLLKVGMTVDYMGQSLKIKEIIVRGTAQVPWLITELPMPIVPCTTVLTDWSINA